MQRFNRNGWRYSPASSRAVTSQKLSCHKQVAFDRTARGRCILAVQREHHIVVGSVQYPGAIVAVKQLVGQGADLKPRLD